MGLINPQSITTSLVHLKLSECRHLEEMTRRISKHSQEGEPDLRDKKKEEEERRTLDPTAAP